MRSVGSALVADAALLKPRQHRGDAALARNIEEAVHVPSPANRSAAARAHSS